jgi:tRNA dimethylallyltransferase
MTPPLEGRVILIAGPTASGKSELALRLAEQLGGTVINADSMQVYRELRILTARPTLEDEARAPHALYGFVSGAEAYSAGRYAVDAARAIEEARNSGRVPIVVGGTGLYSRRAGRPLATAGRSWCAPIGASRRHKGRVELHAVLAARDRNGRRG